MRRFHNRSAEFTLKINLHADNDEFAARAYWRRETGLLDPRFYKTFTKREGTGHRKNHLAHGVCTVRMRRGSKALHRTLAWIDYIADQSQLPGC